VAEVPHPFLFSAHDLSLPGSFGSNINIINIW